MRRLLWIEALCALLLALGSGSALAAEAPNHSTLFEIYVYRSSSGEETLKDPCGLAVDSAGDIYVGDYYADQVVVFGPTRQPPPETARAILPQEDPLDGPCGLAVSGSGALFVNNYHRNVMAFGGPFGAGTLIDAGNSPVTSPALRPTGVAVDPATGRLFVDDRTYVAEYEGSALLRKIGLGSLGDGYGIAVSDYPATAGYLYVPDAKTGTVKIFDPTHNPELIREINGEGTPEGGLGHLVDAAIAVDSSDGHLFLARSQGPLYEHPEALLDEFNPQGNYRGRIFAHGLFAGGPSGLAVVPPGISGEGDVYVSSGNSERGKLFGFGPTGAARTLKVEGSGAGEGTVTSQPAGIHCGGACVAEFNEGATVTLTATPAAGSVFAGWSSACSGTGTCQVTMSQDREVSASFEPAPQTAALGALALPVAPRPPTSAAPLAPRSAFAGSAEVVQNGDLQVTVEGRMSPKHLPREGVAPISVSVSGQVATTDGTQPPQLRKLVIEINRHGRLDYRGLPTCKINQIQPADNARALAACRSALVGQGHFEGTIALPGAAPYPIEGRLLVFNGTEHGHEVLYGHIFAPQPFSISFVMTFAIQTKPHGQYGTTLTANLGKALGPKRNLTGIEMTLSRHWRSGGHRHSFLSAGCPVPKGFRSLPFPLARTSFSFAGGKRLSSTLTSRCTARG